MPDKPSDDQRGVDATVLDNGVVRTGTANVPNPAAVTTSSCSSRTNVISSAALPSSITSKLSDVLPSTSMMQFGSKSVPVICLQQSQVKNAASLSAVVQSLLSSSSHLFMDAENSNVNASSYVNTSNQNMGKISSKYLKPHITFSHPVLTGGKPCSAVLQPTALMVGDGAKGKCIVTYKVLKAGQKVVHVNQSQENKRQQSKSIVGSTPVSIVESNTIENGESTPVSTTGSSLASSMDSTSLSVAGSTLVSNAGSTLVSNAGSTLVSNAGSTLVSNAGSTLVSNAGSTLVSNAGSTLVSNVQSTSASSADSAPVPTVGSIPVPTVGSIPVPTVGSIPVPTVGSIPVPTVGSTPVPTVGSTPVPIVGSTPVPIVGSIPIPTVGSAPVPTVGSTPVPIVGSTPVPIVGSTPVPIVGSTPVPIVGSTPVPIVRSTPVPTVGSTPVPIVGSTPVPTVGSTPVPIVKSTPVPIVGSTLVPIVGSTPVPTVGSTVPIVGSTPVPIVGSTSVPTVGSTVPIVGSTVPIVGSTPVPTVGSTPVPIVGSTPVPIVGSIPVPIGVSTHLPMFGSNPVYIVGPAPASFVGSNPVLIVGSTAVPFMKSTTVFNMGSAAVPIVVSSPVPVMSSTVPIVSSTPLPNMGSTPISFATSMTASTTINNIPRAHASSSHMQLVDNSTLEAGLLQSILRECAVNGILNTSLGIKIPSGLFKINTESKTCGTDYVVIHPRENDKEISAQCGASRDNLYVKEQINKMSVAQSVQSALPYNDNELSVRSNGLAGMLQNVERSAWDIERVLTGVQTVTNKGEWSSIDTSVSLGKSTVPLEESSNVEAGVPIAENNCLVVSPDTDAVKEELGLTLTCESIGNNVISTDLKSNGSSDYAGIEEESLDGCETESSSETELIDHACEDSQTQNKVCPKVVASDLNLCTPLVEEDCKEIFTDGELLIENCVEVFSDDIDASTSTSTAQHNKTSIKLDIANTNEKSKPRRRVGRRKSKISSTAVVGKSTDATTGCAGNKISANMNCSVRLERFILHESSVNLKTVSDKFLCCVSDNVTHSMSKAKCSAKRDSLGSSRNIFQSSALCDAATRKTVDSVSDCRIPVIEHTNSLSDPQKDRTVYALQYNTKLGKAVVAAASSSASKVLIVRKPVANALNAVKDEVMEQHDSTTAVSNKRFKLQRMPGSSNLYMVPYEPTSSIASLSSKPSESAQGEQPHFNSTSNLGTSSTTDDMGEIITIKPELDAEIELATSGIVISGTETVTIKTELPDEPELEAGDDTSEETPSKRARSENLKNLNKRGSETRTRAVEKSIPSTLSTETNKEIGRKRTTASRLQAESTDPVMCSPESPSRSTRAMKINSSPNFAVTSIPSGIGADYTESSTSGSLGHPTRHPHRERINRLKAKLQEQEQQLEALRDPRKK